MTNFPSIHHSITVKKMALQTKLSSCDTLYHVMSCTVQYVSEDRPGEKPHVAQGRAGSGTIRHILSQRAELKRPECELRFFFFFLTFFYF